MKSHYLDFALGSHLAGWNMSHGLSSCKVVGLGLNLRHGPATMPGVPLSGISKSLMLNWVTILLGHAAYIYIVMALNKYALNLKGP